jgi:hypothetical protein
MTPKPIQRRRAAPSDAPSKADRGRAGASSIIPSTLAELCANSPITLRTAILATVASSVVIILRGADDDGSTTEWAGLANVVWVANSAYIFVDRLGTTKKPSAAAVPKHTQGYVLT